MASSLAIFKLPYGIWCGSGYIFIVLAFVASVWVFQTFGQCVSAYFAVRVNGKKKIYIEIFSCFRCVETNNRYVSSTAFWHEHFCHFRKKQNVHRYFSSTEFVCHATCSQNENMASTLAKGNQTLHEIDEKGNETKTHVNYFDQNRIQMPLPISVSIFHSDSPFSFGNWWFVNESTLLDSRAHDYQRLDFGSVPQIITSTRKTKTEPFRNMRRAWCFLNAWLTAIKSCSQY